MERRTRSESYPDSDDASSDLSESEKAILASVVARGVLLDALAPPDVSRYRSAEVGEDLRCGPWTNEEKELFLLRLDEVRGNTDMVPGDWPAFAAVFPNRAGYQCEHFYLQLVSSGELADARRNPLPRSGAPPPWENDPPLEDEENDPPLQDGEYDGPRPIWDAPAYDEEDPVIEPPVFPVPIFRVPIPDRAPPPPPRVPMFFPIPILDGGPIPEAPPVKHRRKVTRMTDEQMIRVIELRHRGANWRVISDAVHRAASTCHDFFDHWEETHTLRGTWGRPPSTQGSPTEIVIAATESNRRSTLDEVAANAGMSPESVRRIRHKYGFHYFGSVVVPRISPEAKARRVRFARRQVANNDGLPIIFTDESMVMQDLNRGGIWRKWGELLEESFYERDHHPLRVMVWGAIGPGFRSPLIRCPPSVNQVTYAEILGQAGIFAELRRRFGRRGFWWQQDNAPAHQPVRKEIAQRYKVLWWPPYSPDLSPIEQMWAIIKKKLKGRAFSDADELFDAISAEWEAVPQETIDNLCSSFKARCQVCAAIGGRSLNGHWTEVHNVHHAAAEAA